MLRTVGGVNQHTPCPAVPGWVVSCKARLDQPSATTTCGWGVRAAWTAVGCHYPLPWVPKQASKHVVCVIRKWEAYCIGRPCRLMAVLVL